jgi:hypothetical protein
VGVDVSVAQHGGDRHFVQAQRTHAGLQAGAAVGSPAVLVVVQPVVHGPELALDGRGLGQFSRHVGVRTSLAQREVTKHKAQVASIAALDLLHRRVGHAASGALKIAVLHQGHHRMGVALGVVVRGYRHCQGRAKTLRLLPQTTTTKTPSKTPHIRQPTPTEQLPPPRLRRPESTGMLAGSRGGAQVAGDDGLVRPDSSPTPRDNPNPRRTAVVRAGSAAWAFPFKQKEIAVSQNLISLVLTDEQLTAIDGALVTLEQNLTGLMALTQDQRRSLAKMGDKSEVFCRQTLKLLAQNPQVVPPSLNVAEAQADLAAFDQLGTFLMRLQRLSERAQDSSTALGSDLMQFALEGYGLLKVSGKNQGLEELRRSLSSRFIRGAARTAAEAAPAVA